MAFPSSVSTAVLTVILTSAVVALVRVLLTLQKAFATLRLQGIPGRKVQWIDPFFPLSTVVAPYFPRPGSVGSFYGKFTLYERLGSTIVSAVRPFSGRLYYWISDADALKTIFGDRHTFSKDVAAYEILEIYGKNLVSSEGGEWKRHKSIASPAFSEGNNALVWDETIRSMNQWFSELNAAFKGEITSTVSVDIVASMTQVTLLVISAAGFGQRMSLKEDGARTVPPGHSLSFSQAISGVLDGLYIKVLTPTFIHQLLTVVTIPFISTPLAKTRKAFDELKAYMLEIISSARDSVIEGKGVGEAALLRALVEANMNQDGGAKKLTDDELLSDIFVFFLAGHETSAHALSFAFILLALYPDVQQKIYKETLQAWPDRKITDSSYKLDMPKFEYTLATFRETIRLYPAEPRLAKLVERDTTITVAQFTLHKDGLNEHGDVRKLPVLLPQGSVVIADILGVHRNPLHWGSDCKDFKSERFIDTDTYKWPRHAFLSFSAGARGCIGSRFSLTESVCILAMLVRRYEVLLPDHVEKMERHQQIRHMTRWTQGVTMTPVNGQLRLRKRTS